MAEFADLTAAFETIESKARGEVRISALRGGTFTLPTKLFVSGALQDEVTQVPSLAFLIVHDMTNGAHKRTLFDLGLRRDTDTYHPKIRDHLPSRFPLKSLPDVRQSLEDGGLGTDAIDEVILSHVHWDHIGTPSDYPNAQFFVGAGSLALLKTGLNGHMSHSNFQPDLFDGLTVCELPDPHLSGSGWQRIGGLDMLDLHDDGAVFAVDSPGHLTGHVALLVRRGHRSWALLVGDACHDSRLLTGEEEIAEWTDTEGRTCCIHMDKKTATETLRTFAGWKNASRQCGIELTIVFAHDALWAELHPDAFFPGLF